MIAQVMQKQRVRRCQRGGSVKRAHPPNAGRKQVGIEQRLIIAQIQRVAIGGNGIRRRRSQ